MNVMKKINDTRVGKGKGCIPDGMQRHVVAYLSTVSIYKMNLFN